MRWDRRSILGDAHTPCSNHFGAAVFDPASAASCSASAGAWLKRRHSILLALHVHFYHELQLLSNENGEWMLRGCCCRAGRCGTLPFDFSLGIDSSIWASMGPAAQVAAQRAGRLRHSLSQFKVLTKLCELGTILTSTSAPTFGVRVLREGPAKSVALGVFDMPHVDSALLPKGAILLYPYRTVPVCDRFLVSLVQDSETSSFTVV